MPEEGSGRLAVLLLGQGLVAGWFGHLEDARVVFVVTVGVVNSGTKLIVACVPVTLKITRTLSG